MSSTCASKVVLPPTAIEGFSGVTCRLTGTAAVTVNTATGELVIVVAPPVLVIEAVIFVAPVFLPRVVAFPVPSMSATVGSEETHVARLETSSVCVVLATLP